MKSRNGKSISKALIASQMAAPGQGNRANWSDIRTAACDCSDWVSLWKSFPGTDGRMVQLGMESRHGRCEELCLLPPSSFRLPPPKPGIFLFTQVMYRSHLQMTMDGNSKGFQGSGRCRGLRWLFSDKGSTGRGDLSTRLTPPRTPQPDKSFLPDCEFAASNCPVITL